MADLTQFDLGSAARVARVVRAVEQEPRSTRPLTFDPVLEAGKKQIRLGRISSDWTSGETAIAERLDADGNPFDPPITFEAVNFFSTVHVPSEGTADVACGLVGGKWILLEAYRDGPIRLGTISADWLHGESITVDPWSEADESFSATNFFRTVQVPAGETVNVACGLVGNTWVLIEADRTAQEETDIRLGRIFSDWMLGGDATVERLDIDGDPYDPPSTFTARNFCRSVYVNSGEEVRVICSGGVLIEAGRGCASQTAAAELDAEADNSSSVDSLSEGDGTQVLVNEQGCAQWFRLASRTIVTNVEFVEGELVKTTEDVFVFAGTAEPSTSTIIGTTECPEPE